MTNLQSIHSGNGAFPRVILFDIDGTLIKPARRGQYRGLINQMLIDIFGTYGRISEVDFGGRTDLAIYREALECEGITVAQIQSRLGELEAGMVAILERMSEHGDVFRLCPGVRELLEALSGDSRFVISLLTGNVERLAEAKLRSVDIWDYFESRGAFGSDAIERDHLPAIAAARISEHIGIQLPTERFIIVGDTPRDISCARHFGARVVAVASGLHTEQQLAQLEPDAVLPNLTGARNVVSLLASI